MGYKDLQKRTKEFAIRIIKLARFLQKDQIGRIIANHQLIRSGTAIAANYRAACRAKSSKDFISKLGIVIEEADEMQFWLEILIEADIIKAGLILDLQKEAGEIVAIMTASKNSAIKNQWKKQKNNYAQFYLILFNFVQYLCPDIQNGRKLSAARGRQMPSGDWFFQKFQSVLALP